MQTSHAGFSKITFILILGILGGMYLVKDDQGVNYLEKTYKTGYWYAVERNRDALEQAKGAQNVMQAHQDDLQKAIDEQ